MQHYCCVALDPESSITGWCFRTHKFLTQLGCEHLLLRHRVGSANWCASLALCEALLHSDDLDFPKIIIHSLIMTTNDERPCFIYAITHIASGRRYVGSCLYPTRRWIEHRSKLKHQKHHCAHLQRAWNLYGIDAFRFSIIQELTTNNSALRAKAELAAIGASECFNSRIANLGLTNFENSPETRVKITAGILKRISEDEEHRKWLAHRGQQLAAHARTPERRAARSVLSKELWTDPKHRRSVSESLAKYWNTPGVREAHSIRVKAHRGTKEARERNSAAMKRVWADPTSGQHTRKLIRWADPKAREIQSAKLREAWKLRRLKPKT